MAGSSFRDTFLAALRTSGMSLAELSRRSGVSYDALNKLKRGSSQSTSAENAAKIAQVLEFEALPIRADALQDQPAGSRLVPVYDVAASAGHGAFIDYEASAYSLAFPPSYLNRLTSSSPSNLAIISVKGESMEPTLLDDDIVLLDASKTDLGYDGLFVLRFNDTLHVKRVGRSAKRGNVMIISDNKDLYPPIDAAMSDVEPVGKVLWYGRKV